VTRLAGRARGALLGLAVGDAMGSTHEFRSWVDRPKYPRLVGGFTAPVGGGAFNLVPGQTTDDTQLASCLARELLERRGWFAIEVAESYLDWYKRGPFDIGAQTAKALRALLAERSTMGEYWSPREVARKAGDAHSAGNGAMMRAGALIAWGLLDGAALDRLLDVAAWDCELTHATPTAILANVAYVASGFLAGLGPKAQGRDILARTVDLVNAWALGRHGGAVFEPYARADVRSATADMRETVRSALLASNRRAGGGGWCHTSLGIAWWHLARDTDYKDAMIDISNRGGDADTNAAIAGGLLGARFGDKAIPLRWLRTVLGHRPVNHARHFATVYHPMRLVELLERRARLPDRLMKAAYGPA
jgi:ADP-ribosyl-[dinitrogen reductase] hydrolase